MGFSLGQEPVVFLSALPSPVNSHVVPSAVQLDERQVTTPSFLLPTVSRRAIAAHSGLPNLRNVYRYTFPTMGYSRSPTSGGYPNRRIQRDFEMERVNGVEPSTFSLGNILPQPKSHGNKQIVPEVSTSPCSVASAASAPNEPNTLRSRIDTWRHVSSSALMGPRPTAIVRSAAGASSTTQRHVRLLNPTF